MTGLTEAAKARTPLVLDRRRHARRRGALELLRRPGPARRGRRRRAGAGQPAAQRATPTPCARSGTAVGQRRAGAAQPAARRRQRRGRLAGGRRRGRLPPRPRAPSPDAVAGGRRGAIAAADRPVHRRRAAAPCSPGAREPLHPARAGRSARRSRPRPMGHGSSTATPSRSASAAGSPRRWRPRYIGARATLILAFGARLNALDDRQRRARRRRREGRPGRPRRERSSALTARRPHGHRRRAPHRRDAAPRGARASAAIRATAASPTTCGPRSPPAAGATSPSRTPRATASSTRARSASRSTTCCRPSAPLSSTPGTSWASRRCTFAVPDPEGFVFTPVLPVDRPRPGERDRRRARAPRPPHRRRARRRRRDDGAPRDRDRRPACSADPLRRLRRRGLRRRGPPLPADGPPVETVQFPDADFAAIARGAGAEGVVGPHARRPRPGRAWLDRRDRPLLVDAKVDPDVVAEWLEEAFRAA